MILILVGCSGDDIPSMYESREKPEATEGDVDERIGGAEPFLYPDREWWEDEGNDYKQTVWRTHLVKQRLRISEQV